MEAKDTVMEETVIDVDKRNPWGGNMVDISEQLEAQAEITWGKAIREVVEWLVKCNISKEPYSYLTIEAESFLDLIQGVYPDNWRAKLESWGI